MRITKRIGLFELYGLSLIFIVVLYFMLKAKNIFFLLDFFGPVLLGGLVLILVAAAFRHKKHRWRKLLFSFIVILTNLLVIFTNVGEIITISTIKATNYRKIKLVERHFSHLSKFDYASIEKELVMNPKSELSEKEKRLIKKQFLNNPEWIYDNTYYYFVVGGILDNTYGYAFKYGDTDLAPSPNGYNTCNVRRIIGKWYFYATI